MNGLKITHVILPIVVGLFLWGADQIWILSVSDAFFADFFLSSYSPMENSPNVAVVLITDTTLDRFVCRSPLDRAFLAGVLRQLIQKHVRAIGIDILLDKPTTTTNDEPLKEVIAQQQVPIVVDYNPEQQQGDKSPFQDFMIPMRARGSTLVSDSLGIVRILNSAISSVEGTKVPALDFALVTQASIKAPVGPLALRYPHLTASGLPIALYSAEAVQSLPENLFKDRIVLIGEAVEQLDQWRTPYSTRLATAYPGEMPGVLLHAIAVDQLIRGDPGPRYGAVVSLLVMLASAALGLTVALLRVGAPLGIALRCLGLLFLPINLTLIGLITDLPIPVVGGLAAFGLCCWCQDAWTARKIKGMAFSHGP